MADKMLIISPSGMGKSTSIQNLPPEDTMVIQCIKKRLPFPHKAWKPWDKKTQTGSTFNTRDFEIMKVLLKKMSDVGKKYVIVDDLSYAITGKTVDDYERKDWEKWGELAWNFTKLLEFIDNLRDDMIVVFLSHTTTEDGVTKFKSAGKFIEEKLDPVSLFEIVFGMSKDDNGSYFITNGTARDPYKSPMNMFKDKQIPNDLLPTIKRIQEFYNS